MDKKMRLTWIVLALVLLLVGAGVLYHRLAPEAAPDRLATAAPTQEVSQATEEIPEPQETPLAPDFTVYDREGNEVRLSDYVGTPVVLNFWASWCGYCKLEMPDFEQAYQELEGSIQFLMVNATDGDQESVESASELIDQEGYTFPVFYDTDQEAVSAYGATSLPVTYFIDKEGHATAYAVGALDADTLRQGIAMIAPEEDVADAGELE